MTNGQLCETITKHFSTKSKTVLMKLSNQLTWLVHLRWNQKLHTCNNLFFPDVQNFNKSRPEQNGRPWWRHQMETLSALVICTWNSPVNSPHKGQWRGAVIFSFSCIWINSWINNREAGDLRRHRAHYDVTVMHFGDGIYVIKWKCVYFFIRFFKVSFLKFNWHYVTINSGGTV